MRKFSKKVYNILLLIGIDPLKFFFFLRGFPSYLKQLRKLKKQLYADKAFSDIKLLPILNERHHESGIMKGHNFYQDLIIAKKIYERNPVKHIDVGSRIDGFVSHVASFREIEIVDIRFNVSKIDNIKFIQFDMMQDLPAKMVVCCESVSSLHAVEHFGLGRYGDPLDVNGHLKGLDNICKMLKKGGKFYFSVPIGKQRIEFNAHRVFDLKYLTEVLCKGYKIDSFAYVDDSGELFENVELSENFIASTYGCYYGCGIFEMTKI
jgi:hypothetical protein